MTLEISMAAMYVMLGIVPFSVLRYYPFLQKLRIGQGLFFSLYAVLVLIETVWFIEITRRGPAFGILDGEMLRLAFYGVHLVLSCFVIRERPEKHLFVWCENFIFSSTLTALANFFDTLIKHETPYLVNNIAMVILLFPFMAAGFHFMKETIIPLLQNNSRRSYLLITSMLLVIFSMGLFTTRELPFQEISPFSLLCIRLAASLGGILACLIFKSLMDEQQKVLLLQQNKQEQEALLSISKEQFAALSAKIGEAKRARHDLKHHFAAIQGYLSQKDYEGLSEYISEEEKILPSGSVLSFCENTTINMILSHYFDRAAGAGVPMEAEAAVPAAISLSYTETWVLLGNLLENALEGSLRIADEQRQIKVRIGYKGNTLGIAVDNLCSEAALIKTDSGYASSKNSENCGNGLSSITLLAEKHGGIAEFTVKDGWFLASVSLRA